MVYNKLGYMVNEKAAQVDVAAFMALALEQCNRRHSVK